MNQEVNVRIWQGVILIGPALLLIGIYTLAFIWAERTGKKRRSK